MGNATDMKFDATLPQCSVPDKRILIWDNDGTITGSIDPNDKSNAAKVILPNVKETMMTADYNFIISGFKSPESEAQNFDPELVSAKFIKLMSQLSIDMAIFSPAIGGVACYVLIKENNNHFTTIKAHENPQYQEYIGRFKKPEIGMFVVLRDYAYLQFSIELNLHNSLMIGDTWHDEQAAEKFGISFLHVKQIHAGCDAQRSGLLMGSDTSPITIND